MKLFPKINQHISSALEILRNVASLVGIFYIVMQLMQYSSLNLPLIPLCKFQQEFCYEKNLGSHKSSEVIVTSDTGLFLNQIELSILGTLAKKAHNIFEFGTGTGRTTWVMAKNSPADAKIHTINLLPHMLDNLASKPEDSISPALVIKSDSQYTTFFFDDSEVAHKITLESVDSKQFNETAHLNKYDLIFVDGGHTYSYIKNDTEKAFKMLSPGGTIIWDDYGLVSDVTSYLNHLSEEKQLYHLEGTKLVAFRDESLAD